MLSNAQQLINLALYGSSSPDLPQLSSKTQHRFDNSIRKQDTLNLLFKSEPGFSKLQVRYRHRLKTSKAVKIIQNSLRRSFARRRLTTALADIFKKKRFQVQFQQHMIEGIRSMKDHGMSCKDIKDKWGFHPKWLKKAGFSSKQLKEDCDISLAELIEAGFSCKQLKDECGFSLAQLKRHWNLEDLKTCFTCREIVESGFSPVQLKRGGYGCEDLKMAGVTVKQLLEAERSFSDTEIIAAFNLQRTERDYRHRQVHPRNGSESNQIVSYGGKLAMVSTSSIEVNGHQLRSGYGHLGYDNVKPSNPCSAKIFKLQSSNPESPWSVQLVRATDNTHGAEIQVRDECEVVPWNENGRPVKISNGCGRPLYPGDKVEVVSYDRCGGLPICHPFRFAAATCEVRRVMDNRASSSGTTYTVPLCYLRKMEPLVPMWEMEEMEYANEEDEIEAEGEEEGVEAEESTLADGTTVYYVEDTGLCYSTDGEMEELGSYNSDTNSLEELNLTP